MEFYKLAGIGDIAEIVVHMRQAGLDERGVIGIGEPPTIARRGDRQRRGQRHRRPRALPR